MQRQSGQINLLLNRPHKKATIGPPGFCLMLLCFKRVGRKITLALRAHNGREGERDDDETLTFTCYWLSRPFAI